jgi:hypothetical protein
MYVRDTSTRLSAGISTPSNLGINQYSITPTQPWRCLCRGFLQITRTTFLRFTILQLAQSLFTDGRTFIIREIENRGRTPVVIFGDK